MKTALMTLCAAALLGGSASAEPVLVSREQLPSERVNYADLNLDSAAGQAALKRRIRSAATRVCEFTGDRRLDTYLVTHKCYVSAFRDGLRQMDTVIAGRATGSTIAAASLTIRGE